MPKLSINYPNTFNIDDDMYPAFGQYIAQVRNGKVGLEETGDNNTIVKHVLPNQWKNKDNVAYGSLEDLLVDIALATTWGVNYISTDVANIIETTLKLRGTEDPQINGVGTPQAPVFYEYVLQKDAVLTGMKFYMEDGTGFTDTKFGGIDALDNGLILMIKNVPAGMFKTNLHIALASDKVEEISALAATKKHMLATREFRRKIFIKAGESVQLIAQDDLSGLSVFNCFIQGYRL